MRERRRKRKQFRGVSGLHLLLAEFSCYVNFCMTDGNSTLQKSNFKNTLTEINKAASSKTVNGNIVLSVCVLFYWLLLHSLYDGEKNLPTMNKKDNLLERKTP